MIENNPVDLAYKMLRFEKRLKAIRLLSRGRRTPTITLFLAAVLLMGGTYVQLWVLRDRLPSEILLIATSLVFPIVFFTGEFFVTQRRVEAVVDLLLSDIEETTEVESEQALQSLKERKPQLTEAVQ